MSNRDQESDGAGRTNGLANWPNGCGATNHCRRNQGLSSNEKRRGKWGKKRRCGSTLNNENDERIDFDGQILDKKRLGRIMRSGTELGASNEKRSIRGETSDIRSKSDRKSVDTGERATTRKEKRKRGGRTEEANGDSHLIRTSITGSEEVENEAKRAGSNEGKTTNKRKRKEEDEMFAFDCQSRLFICFRSLPFHFNSRPPRIVPFALYSTTTFSFCSLCSKPS